MRRIHAILFEESVAGAGVDLMEPALLNLSPDNTDIEAIDHIFRAAHIARRKLI